MVIKIFANTKSRNTKDYYRVESQKLLIIRRLPAKRLGESFYIVATIDKLYSAYCIK